MSVSTYALGAFTASAMLSDGVTGSRRRRGADLLFSYLGMNQTGGDDGLGVGTTVYDAGPRRARHVRGDLVGNPTYAQSSSTGSATVLSRPTWR